MPRKPIEYRCLLISPSDVKTERNALTKTINEWNAHIGEALSARVNLVRWESHSVPDSLAAPQDSLNRQIVENCDFGIGVFWTRVGTKTATDESGSAEEILEVSGQDTKRVVRDIAEIIDHKGQPSLRRRGDWVPVARQRGIEQIVLAFLDAVRAGERLSAEDALRTHELCERIVSAAQEAAS